MQETQVQYVVPKNPLEKEMATHSSILAWKIPWTEKSGGLQSMGSQRVGHDLVTKPPPSPTYITGLGWIFNMDYMLRNSVVSDHLQPHGLQPTKLLYPWDFPGQNPGVGCHFLLHYMYYLT